MEHGVHEAAFVQTIEHGTCEVAYTIGNNPRDGCCAHILHERFEGHKHTQPHQTEAQGFEVAVVFQAHKRCNGSCQCTAPDETKQSPTPIALVAKGDERDGGVGAGNVPIDGGMVEFAQTLLPLRLCRHGMIGCGRDIRHEHAKQIENHAQGGPTIGITHGIVQI